MKNDSNKNFLAWQAKLFDPWEKAEVTYITKNFPYVLQGYEWGWYKPGYESERLGIQATQTQTSNAVFFLHPTMLLHCRILPRFLFPISTFNPPLPSLYAHPLLLPNKKITVASAFSHSASFVPRSHLSAPSESFIDTDEDHQIQIPLEKLFVPPEVELPEGSAAVVLGRVLKGSNIVLGPHARDAQVTTAEFVKSSVRSEDCPADGLPEFALVGRSNVGKSSLLNSLVRRKRLALTSKKPGKTQCINHFRINDSWYLVDLPGYG